MSSDVTLVRAHFDSALTTLAQLQDFTSAEDQARLLELATLAHGAGARRLRRITDLPYQAPELLELRQIEERVRSAIVRAQQEHLTRPGLALPATG